MMSGATDAIKESEAKSAITKYYLYLVNGVRKADVYYYFSVLLAIANYAPFEEVRQTALYMYISLGMSVSHKLFNL